MNKQEGAAGWDADRIAALCSHWANGRSAAEIAQTLGGTSRSAVLGKLHRLGLLGSRAAASAPRRYDGPSAAPAVGASRPVVPGRSRLSPPTPRQVPWREAVFAPLPGVAARPWLSREFGECAFPVGREGEAILSCCAPIQARSSYCARHHRIVFRRESPAARAAQTERWAAAAERWAA